MKRIPSPATPAVRIARALLTLPFAAGVFAADGTPATTPASHPRGGGTARRGGATGRRGRARGGQD